MANRQERQNDGKPRIIRINLTWILYVALIVGIGYMLLGNSGPQPQKVEWAQVQEMVRAGDVKEIHFIRNDFRGTVTLRRESAHVEKYLPLFSGGELPKSSPEFNFLVSSAFNAEQEFAALNADLPEESRIRVIVENESSFWKSIGGELIWFVLLIVMWIWMFRGMSRMGGGMPGQGGGGIFSVGKSTGKLADKNKVNVTF